MSGVPRSDALAIITESGERYLFRLVQQQSGARRVSWQSVPMQPADYAMAPWREPLHAVWAGVARDRFIGNRMSYHSANADAVWQSIITLPPKVIRVELPLATRLAKAVYWNGKLWILAGRSLYSLNYVNTLSLEKDLYADYEAEGVDMAVFNGQLVIAMGEDHPIVAMSDDGTWAVADNNIRAIALGVVGERLWRAAQVNKVVACFSDPLDELSWSPDINAVDVPQVGDSSYPVHTLLDYGGVVWGIKPDGVYQPDATARFYTQAPQLKPVPDPQNGVGAWVGLGFLWVPSVLGLIRIAPGEAETLGYEFLERGHGNARILAGLEYRGDLWVLCRDDEDGLSLFRVRRDLTGRSGKALVWHQLVKFPAPQAGALSTPSSLVALNQATATPTLVCGSGHNELYLITLGEGGRDIDSDQYSYGKDMELITGSFGPVQDWTVENVFLGVELVCSVPSDAWLELSAAADPQDETEPDWLTLVSTETGNEGEPKVVTTDGPTSVVRYSPGPLCGHRFTVRLRGHCDDPGRRSRPEVYQMWAFGYSRPRQTDVLQVTVYAAHATVDGHGVPLRPEEILRLFDHWASAAEQLRVELAGYPLGDTDDRWVVIGLQAEEARMQPGWAGRQISFAHALTVRLLRLEYGRR